MKLSVAALCLASVGGSTFADVAYNNLGPGDTYSGNGWILYGPLAPPPWRQGFRFVSQASGTITNLVVPIQYISGDNMFEFEVFSDAGGTPGTSLGIIGQTAGFINSAPPLPPPVQVPSSSGIVLTSGTTYWLVGNAPGNARGTWHQNSTGQVDLRAYMSHGSTVWTTGTVDIAAFRIEVTGSGCYANCDNSSGSPLLTANDFSCFLNRYVAGESYANCDGSTGNPTLTANDFSCFLNRYVEGCT